MIAYKEQENFMEKSPIENENIIKNEEEEDDENEDIIFEYDDYKSLKYGEKMRYIVNYYYINDDDLIKISSSIICDLINGFMKDLKSALSAMKILLEKNFVIEYNDTISSIIINSLIFNELFDDVEYLIINYIFPNYDCLSMDMIELFNSKIFDDKLFMNSKIINLIAKLIRFSNYQYPLEAFESLLQKYDVMSFDEKNALCELCCSLILFQKEAIFIMMKYKDNIISFIFETIQTKLISGLFIISSFGNVINFADDFMSDLIDKIQNEFDD